MTLPDEQATARLAAGLAPRLHAGDVLALHGGLGAGKSVFARALIRALGDPAETVPSPTFTLVQTYDLPQFTLWHFDLFRLEAPEDAFELDIEEAFSDGVSLIEWPDRLGPWLPDERLDISFTYADRGRRAAVTGRGNWPGRLKGLPHD